MLCKLFDHLIDEYLYITLSKNLEEYYKSYI